MKQVVTLTESNIKAMVNEVLNTLAVEDAIRAQLEQDPNADENAIFQAVVSELGVAPVDFDRLMEIIGEFQSSYVNGFDGDGCILQEDMTHSQVESAIEDFMKTRSFEKRVNNIVVDTVSDFLESMWTKKSFWKTMLKKK